jgi:multidrug efflux system outer membrane protein
MTPISTPPRPRTLLPLTLAAALTACAVPPRQAAPALTAQAPLGTLVATTQADWPAADWWTRYQDPTLNTLMQQALSAAPALAQAQARLAQAQAAIAAQAANAGALVAASADVQRQRISEHGLFPVRFLGFTWYSQADLGMQLQYDVDWWGRHRAELAAATGQARAAAAEADQARLLLTSAVAQTYFGWQADQARLQLAAQAVAAQQRLLTLARRRLAQGVDGNDAVLAAETALANAERARTALAASATSRQIALAALLGISPDALPTLTPRPLPAVSAGLPADASLQLLGRRPDVVASRWRVEAAVQDVAAARAAFFPDLSLKALVGLSSIELDRLLTAGSRIALLQPAVSLPLFDAGRLRAAHGIRQAQLDSAVADYHARVMDAARDVQQQALQVTRLAEEAAQQDAALQAARTLQANAEARARAGLGDDRSRLQASLTLLQAQDASTVLAATRLNADIALIQSLGGGYVSTAPTSSPSASSQDAFLP